MVQLREQVKTIFGQALAICSASERAEFLDQACAGNDALRAEVDGLLGAHDRAGSFLGSEPASMDSTVDKLGRSELVGTQISGPDGPTLPKGPKGE